MKTGTHPRVTTERNVAASASSSRSLGFSYDWERESQHHRPRLLPLDAVDLQAAFRARTGLSGRAARLVVSRARHDARERGGHRRQIRGRRLSVRAPAVAPMGAQDHGIRRRAARGPRRSRLAGKHEGDAAQLDRPQRRAPRSISRVDGQADLDAARLHDAARYAVRRHLHGPRARARARRSARGAPTSAPAVDAYREQAARKSELERSELQKDKTGVFTGAYAINPANGANDSDLDCRLRAGRLRHGRDHGRARTRPARLRVRDGARRCRSCARSSRRRFRRRRGVSRRRQAASTAGSWTGSTSSAAKPR